MWIKKSEHFKNPIVLSVGVCYNPKKLEKWKAMSSEESVKKIWAHMGAELCVSLSSLVFVSGAECEKRICRHAREAG